MRAPCEAFTAAGTDGEEDKMASLLAQREQLTEGDREARKSLMKRKKSTAPRMDPCKTPCLNRVKRLGRTRPGFVQIIQNGLKKELD